jgi:hypothetical protein
LQPSGDRDERPNELVAYSDMGSSLAAHASQAAPTATVADIQ